MEKFKSNTLYKLQDSDADRYTAEADDGKRYEFALSADYAEGASLADCWIQSADGEIHPGYSQSPVPILWEDLIEINQPNIT